MRYHGKTLGLITLSLFIISKIAGQTTPAHLVTTIPWQEWYFVDSHEEIEVQFNLGRREEERQLGLPSGSLGALSLPSEFLELGFDQQALIILNAERTSRGGNAFEGVELNLNRVAQGHADDMFANSFFGHVGSDDSSPYTRIKREFDGCLDDRITSENIYWTSLQNFEAAIAVALYNFIYDDACCFWGHRDNCLYENSGNNNYGDPNKYGLVGFGLTDGGAGTYFVMDFLDPVQTCHYTLADFGVPPDGPGCTPHLSLPGPIVSGLYQASETVSSNGVVAPESQVEIIASMHIILENSFEVPAGSSLTATIGSCQQARNGLAESIQPKVQEKNRPVPQFRIGG